MPLPHQIPFRAASRIERVDERTAVGTFVCTGNDSSGLDVMLVEAMAQIAGSLVFTGRGLLTGIDSCELLRRIEPGDVVTCRLTLDAAFGGTYRFSGTGTVDGVDAARGRFYLAAQEA